MTKILCMAGRKQSGKSSAVNFVFGLAVRSMGCTKEFRIGPDGKLNVVHIDSGDWAVFDPCDRRPEVQDWLADNVWPVIKCYNFADPLKETCIEIFGLSEAQCYGSDADKNGLTHIKWEDVPAFNGYFNGKPCSGYMSAREILQYMGTDVFRKMDPDCWVRSILNRIEAEAPEYALIGDCRFPNESAGVNRKGGTVLNFTRKISEDSHASEAGLDDDLNVSFHFDNQDLTLEEKNANLFEFLVDIGWAQEEEALDGIQQETEESQLSQQGVVEVGGSEVVVSGQETS